MINVSIYLVMLFVVLTDAMSDAHLDQEKTRDHPVEAMNIFLYFVLMVLYRQIEASIILYALMYVCIRIVFFNPLYNAMRGFPIGFFGYTDQIFDRWMSKLPGWAHGTIIMAAMFVSIVICINL